jgi:hypothetical protein
MSTQQTMPFTPMTPGTMHVFEQAGLGQAPYKFKGVEQLRGPITLEQHNGVTVQVGAPGQPMGCCQYCSTNIAWLFWLESADGKIFYVGSDCIYKSGDVGLKAIIDPILAKHEKELRDSRNKLLLDMFNNFVAEHGKPTPWTLTTPHPNYYRARLGETVGNYNEWVFKHAGTVKQAAMARKMLTEAGVDIPNNKMKKRMKPQAGQVAREFTIPGMFGGIKIIDIGDDVVSAAA